MTSELQVGLTVAIVGASGTLLVLGLVGLLTAALRRAFPAKKA